jgi:hypothetical protein
MIYLIIKTDFDTMESMGNEEYTTMVGYAETEKEANDHIEELKKNGRTFKMFRQEYPFYTVQKVDNIKPNRDRTERENLIIKEIKDARNSGNQLSETYADGLTYASELLGMYIDD